MFQEQTEKCRERGEVIEVDAEWEEQGVSTVEAENLWHESKQGWGANKMQPAYHEVLKENSLLKQRNEKLEMIIANLHKPNQMNTIDDDFGHSPSRNKQKPTSSSQLSEGDLSLQHSNIQNNLLIPSYQKFKPLAGKRNFCHLIGQANHTNCECPLTR